MSEALERKILAIESAIHGGSISLFRGTTLMVERVGDGFVSRAENLLSDIADSLDEAGLTISDIDSLAVSVGPGSYTGVRIGIATIMGLRRGLRIPCHGISVVEAMSLLTGTRGPKVCIVPVGRQSYSIHNVMPNGETLSGSTTVTSSDLERLIETSGNTEIIVHTQVLDDLSGKFSDRIIVDAGRNLSRYIGIAVIHGFRLRNLTPVYATAAHGMPVRQEQQWSIGTASEEDIPELIRIGELCGLSEWSIGGYFEELKRPDPIVWSVRDQQQIIGLLVARITGPEAELFNIAVLPEHRGKGIGDWALDRFIDLCRRSNVTKIWLDVRVSNTTAKSMYNRRLFRETARRKNFYSNPPEDSTTMSLDLNADPEKP